MKIFVFGASILTSYWNGATTYYRGIYKYLARRGHQITFASPDAFERQQHHDEGDFSYVNAVIYKPTSHIDAMLELAAGADVVVKHSGLGVDDELLERRVETGERLERGVGAWMLDVDGARLDDPVPQQVPGKSQPEH